MASASQIPIYHTRRRTSANTKEATENADAEVEDAPRHASDSQESLRNVMTSTSSQMQPMEQDRVSQMTMQSVARQESLAEEEQEQTEEREEEEYEIPTYRSSKRQVREQDTHPTRTTTMPQTRGDRQSSRHHHHQHHSIHRHHNLNHAQVNMSIHREPHSPRLQVSIQKPTSSRYTREKRRHSLTIETPNSLSSSFSSAERLTPTDQFISTTFIPNSPSFRTYSHNHNHASSSLHSPSFSPKTAARVRLSVTSHSPRPSRIHNHSHSKHEAPSQAIPDRYHPHQSSHHAASSESELFTNTIDALEKAYEHRLQHLSSTILSSLSSLAKDEVLNVLKSTNESLPYLKARIDEILKEHIHDGREDLLNNTLRQQANISAKLRSIKTQLVEEKNHARSREDNFRITTESLLNDLKLSSSTLERFENDLAHERNMSEERGSLLKSYASKIDKLKEKVADQQRIIETKTKTALNNEELLQAKSQQVEKDNEKRKQILQSSIDNAKRAELAEKANTILQTQAQARETTIRDLEREISELHEKVDNMKSKYRSTKQEVKQIETEKAKLLDNEESRITERMAPLHQTVANIQKEKDALKMELEQEKAKRESLDESLKDSEGKFKQLEKTLSSALRERAELLNQVERSSDLLEQMQVAIQTSRNLEIEYREQYKRRRKREHERKIALQEACKNRIDSEVTERVQHERERLDHLKAQLMQERSEEKARLEARRNEERKELEIERSQFQQERSILEAERLQYQQDYYAALKDRELWQHERELLRIERARESEASERLQARMTQLKPQLVARAQQIATIREISSKLANRFRSLRPAHSQMRASVVDSLTSFQQSFITCLSTIQFHTNDDSMRRQKEKINLAEEARLLQSSLREKDIQNSQQLDEIFKLGERAAKAEQEHTDSIHNLNNERRKTIDEIERLHAIIDQLEEEIQALQNEMPLQAQLSRSQALTTMNETLQQMQAKHAKELEIASQHLDAVDREWKRRQEEWKSWMNEVIAMERNEEKREALRSRLENMSGDKDKTLPLPVFVGRSKSDTTSTNAVVNEHSIPSTSSQPEKNLITKRLEMAERLVQTQSYLQSINGNSFYDRSLPVPPASTIEIENVNP